MNHEQLVLKAVLTARKYNKQLNKEALIYKYSLISDSLLKAYIDEYTNRCGSVLNCTIDNKHQSKHP